MTSSEIGRYYRTVRHLRPRQIWTRLARRAFSPKADLRPRPPLRVRSGPFAEPVRREVWTSPDTVRLLNIDRTFASGVDWTPADEPRLFRYELNYFAGLPSAPASEATVARLLDWMEKNPPGTADAWDPYPTSRRIINWIKWLTLRSSDGSGTGPPESHDGTGSTAPEGGEGPAGVSGERLLDSLAVQARWLERRIEYDISANHLFVNAVALVHAGAFFGGDEGGRWLSTGSSILKEELVEQLLADGGHYERSPMYHAIALEDLLDVVNIAGAYHDTFEAGGFPTDAAVASSSSMLTWLKVMTHPDGEIAFFGDAAIGGAAAPAQLLDYASRLGVGAADEPTQPLHVLGGTGFFRFTSRDGRTVAFLDAAGSPPDHQPGHMHCDALSIEVSRDGRRIIVNAGTSTYEEGAARARDRSTAAHSTLRIDGEEQAEMWSSHRVGRRAGPGLAGVNSHDEPASAYAMHGGYSHLPDGLVHRRTLTLNDARLEIADEIHTDVTFPGVHDAELFLHLHPDVSVQVEGTRIRLKGPGGDVGVVDAPEGAAVSLREDEWHPGFNVSRRSLTIVMSVEFEPPVELVTVLEWTRP